MTKVIVNEFLTLDGVMQAPGGEDEDRSGGFENGGWQMQYFDAIAGEAIGAGMAEAGGFLWGAGPTRSSPRTGPTLRRRTLRSPVP
jgi:hypothetical protein